MYIPHPPWANTLDRGLRAVGYLALSVFSIREAGLMPYTPDAAIWYNLAVHMVLAATAGGCALACLSSCPSSWGARRPPGSSLCPPTAWAPDPPCSCPSCSCCPLE